MRRIPRGKVATYGQIAALAGLPGRARLVGHALSALDEDSPAPWHRVVNAQGHVSPRGDEPSVARQYALLRREGVKFTPSGAIRLSRFQWRPQRRQRLAFIRSQRLIL